jgi:hypothetical protein
LRIFCALEFNFLPLGIDLLFNLKGHDCKEKLTISSPFNDHFLTKERAVEFGQGTFQPLHSIWILETQSQQQYLKIKYNIKTIGIKHDIRSEIKYTKVCKIGKTS